MEFPPELQTELSKWNNGDGITPIDWIVSIGSHDHFAGYCSLIWPLFQKYENKIFLTDLLEGRKDEFATSSPSDRSDLQAMINAFDVASIFGGAADSISDEHLLYLANTLQQAWTCKLALEYPNSSAQVVIDNNLAETGIGDLFVTVVQRDA